MTLHKNCKDFFLAESEKLEKEVYWTGADAGSLKNLLKKLRFSFESKNKRSPTDEELFDGFKIVITRLPQWYKDKAFSIKTINSSYDNIINQIKQEHSNTKESRHQRAFAKIDQMLGSAG